MKHKVKFLNRRRNCIRPVSLLTEFAEETQTIDETLWGSPIWIKLTAEK